MIRLICSVFDTASQLYGQPLFVVAKGQAIRSFSDEVQRKHDDNALNKHPEDFELHYLGDFDDVNGNLIANGPQLLIRGKDCIATIQ